MKQWKIVVGAIAVMLLAGAGFVSCASQSGSSYRHQPSHQQEPGSAPKSDAGSRHKNEPGSAPKAEPGSAPKAEPGSAPKAEPGSAPKAEPGSGSR